MASARSGRRRRPMRQLLLRNKLHGLLRGLCFCVGCEVWLEVTMATFKDCSGVLSECKMTCKSTGCSCIKWQVWCECVTEDIAVDSDYDFTDVSLKSLMLLILNSIRSSHFLEPRPLFKFDSIRFLKFIASRISQFPSDYKFTVLPPKAFIFL